MTPLALVLVLLAAVLHASWNVLVKRIEAGGAALGIYGALSAACYAPLAFGLIAVRRPSLSAAGAGVIVGSAILHTGYFLSLQRGYRAGDLSIVYPVARDTGPLLSTVGALVLLLAPLAAARWEEVRRHWRAHRVPLLAIAVLSPLSYILVLTAMVFTPVSFVAPAREISILIGTAMGTQLLAEGHARHRLLGAAAMVAGVTALALG
jgi:drug/metabolite transporter (DMT)-like permease